MIDEIDRQILTLMQGNGRIANAEIARSVGMAPSAILERIRKLEERGLIRGYTALLDPAALGQGLLAYLFVTTDRRTWNDDAADVLAAIEEVQEVHHIAGEDCFLVKVRTKDTRALGRLLQKRIGLIPGIAATRTTIVLDTVKETTDLPLTGLKEVENDA